MPSTNERASRIGHGFVPKWWIVAFTVLLLVLAAALLYSLWAFWPSELEDRERQPGRASSHLFRGGLRRLHRHPLLRGRRPGGRSGGSRPHAPLVLDVRRHSIPPLELDPVQPAAPDGRRSRRHRLLSRLPRRAVLDLDLCHRCEPVRIRSGRGTRRPLLGAGDREAAPRGKGDVRRGAEVRTRHFSEATGGGSSSGGGSQGGSPGTHG